MTECSWQLTPTILLSPFSSAIWYWKAASAISDMNQPSSMPRRSPRVIGQALAGAASAVRPAPRCRRAVSGRAAHGEDPVEDRVGLGLDLVGERLDVPGAAERVGDVDDAGLLHDHLLGAQRDLGGLLATAARASRRGRWCAASWCRRAPRRAPRCRCGRRCCRAAGRSARRRRSGCGSAATAPSRSSRRRRRAASAPRSGGRPGTSRSPRRSRRGRRRRTTGPARTTSTSRPRDRPSSTYPKPSASVNASSCAAVEPASRMW